MLELVKNNWNKLYKFQKEIIDETLATTSPVIMNGSEMGLGKTIHTIFLLNSFYLNYAKKARTIIICPAHLVVNWKNELDNWYIDKSLSLIHI